MVERMASSMVREGLVVPFLRLSCQGLVLSPRTGGAWPHATSEPTLSPRVARARVGASKWLVKVPGAIILSELLEKHHIAREALESPPSFRRPLAKTPGHP